MKQCYLCGSAHHSQIADRIRDRDDIAVLKCDDCGLVFLSSFDHITENFYKESKIHKGKSSLDILEWIKATRLDDARRVKMLKWVLNRKNILDFGAGNCNFLNEASAFVNQAVGIEPEIRVRQQLMKKIKGKLKKNPKDHSVTLYENISEIGSTKFDIITLFHVLEHLPDPRTILSKLKDLIAVNGSMFIETPNADDALISLYKNKPFMDSTYWSCHLFLYTQETLKELANQSGLQMDCVNQLQRYPLSNHLYWLAKGKPDGTQEWSSLDSDDMNDSYEASLASLGKCDTLMGIFST